MILTMNEDGEFDTSGMTSDSDLIRQKPFMQEGFVGTVREYRHGADSIISQGATCAHPDCNVNLREQEGYYCDTTISRHAPTTTFRYLCILHGEEGNTGDLFAPPSEFRQLAAA